MTFPTSDHLRRTLSDLGAVHEIPIADERGRPYGNNGDLLMYNVYRKMTNDLGISFLSEPQEAQFYVVPPNGALLERYAFPSRLEQRMRELPVKPVIIYPSSAYFPTMDPAAMFGASARGSIWILREPVSLAHLKNDWGRELARAGVELVLDHDVVATGTTYVRELLGVPSWGAPLIAARRDPEATPSADWSTGPAGTLRRGAAARARILDTPFGRVATRYLRHRQAVGASAELLARLDVAEQELFRAASKLVMADISANHVASYNAYRRILRNSSVVLTNRLHVALPASALGKQVYLVDSGYHKLRGVYDHSLSNVPNVKLVS